MIKKDAANPNEEVIDLGLILSLLWKHVALILTCGIICAAALFLAARMFITPKYQANALLFVNNSTLNIGSLDLGTTNLTNASSYVNTYVEILKSRSNMELVIEQSGVPYSYEQLRQMVSATAVNTTGLFQVSVTSPNPEEARTLANTIAVILPDKISDIVANSSVEVVDYAVTPHTRVSPSYIKYAAIGLLAGIVLASAVVLVISYFDDVIHDEDYLLQSFDAPILATIPDLMAKSTKKYGYYGAYAQASKGGKA